MDAGRTTEQRTVKIELLSQWKLEAEFRKKKELMTTTDMCIKNTI